MPILDLGGISFHAVVVFGLSKNLLFKSVLGHFFYQHLFFRLYCKSGKVPPYALAFMTLISYRVHSIFVLRLFNDPVAMVLLYAALNLFADDYWSLGSVFFR